jgi:hypothetical protein
VFVYRGTHFSEFFSSFRQHDVNVNLRTAFPLFC